MSSALLSTISPSTIDSAVRPIRDRKKTPKALHKKNPSSTRKIKSSVIPLSLPPPFSLEMESDGVTSPIDHLLEMCQQAIPVKNKTALSQLENEESASSAENSQVSTLVALLTAKLPLSRGQKRKLTKVVPVSEPMIPSSVETPVVSSPENSATPTLISILNDSLAASTENYELPTTPLSSPPVLISMKSGSDYSANGGQAKRKSPPVHHNSESSNCGTRETTLWRRNEEGSIECNSCLLYFKKNGIKRPMNLQNRVIFKRQRKSSSDGIEKNERTSEEKMIENIAPM